MPTVPAPTRNDYTDPNQIPMDQLVEVGDDTSDYADPNLIPAEFLQPIGKPSYADVSLLDAVKEGISVAPQNAKEYVSLFLHPIETGKAVADTAAGFAKLGFLRTMADWMGVDMASLDTSKDAQVQRAEAMEDFLTRRYSTWEGFKEAVATDPIGVVADVASVLIPVGEGLKAAGLTKVGSAVSKTGAVIEPTSLMARPITTPLKLLVQQTELPGKLWARGAKMASKLSERQRLAIGKTAVENKLTFSLRSLDKTRELISGLGNKIDTMIDSSVRSGSEIPLDRLFKDFTRLKDNLRFEGGSLPKTAIKRAERVENQIREANTRLKLIRKDGALSLEEASEMTVREVQELKKSLYSELAGIYTDASRTPISKQASKLIAKNAKEAIEEIIPEVKQLNKQEGALIDVYEAIEATSSQLSRGDLVPIKPAVEAAIGRKVAGAPGALIGGTMGILDRKAVKARLAVLLQILSNRGVNVKPAMIRLGIAELGQYIPEEETEE